MTSDLRRVAEKGLRRSASLGAALIWSRARRLRSPRPQYVLLSHTIDNTGAPLVLVAIAEELAATTRGKRIRVLAPAVSAAQLERLRSSGVSSEEAAAIGSSLSRFHLGVRDRDFVLLNTVAVHENYQQAVLDELLAKRLEHAYWFIHENVGQLSDLETRLTDEPRLRELRLLVSDGRLTVLVPSLEMKSQYDALFRTSNVRVVALRIDVDDRFCLPRPASDYQSLRFSIVGDAVDSRKGQALALAAFEHFVKRYLEESPSSYREFTLSLIGVRESENGRELGRVGEGVLGRRFKIYPRMTPHQVLELTSSHNATICCSEHESFALYVAEAMAMGHVLLRNRTGGSEEQLIDGVNGLAITDDPRQFAAMIERLLNRNTTSDADLAAMGAASQRRVEPFKRSTYLPQLELV